VTELIGTHPLDMEARFAARWAQSSGAGAEPPAGASKTESDTGASSESATRADTAQATGVSVPSPVAVPTLSPVPENVAALRKSAPLEDRLYGASGYEHIAIDLPDVQPEAASAIRGEFNRMLADASLSPGDAETVVNVVRAGFSNPPNAATREAWRAQISDADRNEALALVARDPRASAIVTQSYAIEHPRIVQILAERARAERARSRL
jgi:hypothetical protein